MTSYQWGILKSCFGNQGIPHFTVPIRKKLSKYFPFKKQNDHFLNASCLCVRDNIKTRDRDPTVPNAKTRDRVPADLGQSHPILGFSSPPNPVKMAARMRNVVFRRMAISPGLKVLVYRKFI